MDTTTIVKEYSKNIPTYKEMYPKKLSDQEIFIKSQPVIREGTFLRDDSGFYSDALDLDCSQFLASYVSVSVCDADCLKDECQKVSGNLPLTQKFFNKLFKGEKVVPKCLDLRECGREFSPEPEDILHVICTVYPVIPLDNLNRILYKLDVSVGVRGTLPLKTKQEIPVPALFLQKHFIADKEGLIFQTEAEEALQDCFSKIKDVFLETKDKRIFI